MHPRIIEQALKENFRNGFLLGLIIGGIGVVGIVLTVLTIIEIA